MPISPQGSIHCCRSKKAEIRFSSDLRFLCLLGVPYVTWSELSAFLTFLVTFTTLLYHIFHDNHKKK